MGGESAKGNADSTEPGLAASLLAWVPRAIRNGLGGFGRDRSERRMELVETLQLGGKRQLMLVVCEGQRYLVGAGGDSVHSITEVGQRRPSSLRPLAMGGSLQQEIEPPTAEREMGWSQ